MTSCDVQYTNALIIASMQSHTTNMAQLQRLADSDSSSAADIKSITQKKKNTTSSPYHESIKVTAVCTDAGDDAGGQNEELHHLQGLLLAQRCLMPGLISALHHN